MDFLRQIQREFEWIFRNISYIVVKKINFLE